MTAEEALRLTTGNGPRNDAIAYGILNIEEKIKDCARKGRRSCFVNFYSFPGTSKDFYTKYGNNENYHSYNVEIDIKKYFSQNGFTFKYVTDDICGGVLQDPYWTINW